MFETCSKFDTGLFIINELNGGSHFLVVWSSAKAPTNIQGIISKYSFPVKGESDVTTIVLKGVLKGILS